MTFRIRAQIAAGSVCLIGGCLIGSTLLPSAHADPAPKGFTGSSGFEPAGVSVNWTRALGTRPSSPLIIKRIKRTVHFAPLSSTLDHESQAILARAAKLVPASATGVTVRSIGYVQQSAFHGNDISLATTRARSAAAALARLHVQGDYSVEGRGQAEQGGALGRRAEITITFTPN